MKTILFACVHNAGRSQMAAALFNGLADLDVARAISAGTNPADRVHPEVVAAMRGVGIDLSSAKPQRLTAGLARGVHLLITMGCGDECPVVPGVRRDDWPLKDPKGQSIDAVREILDEVRQRVEQLVVAEGWRKRTTSALESARHPEPRSATTNPIVITAAGPDDEGAIGAMLRRAGLPIEVEGLPLADFLVARNGGQIIGTVAIEAHARAGLLRSLAVEPTSQKRGFADLLVDRAMARARERNLDSVWLLTASAAAFFSRWGFRESPRGEAPAVLQQHAQFRSVSEFGQVHEPRTRRAGPCVPARYPAAGVRRARSALLSVALDHAELTWYEVDPGTRFERHAHDVDQITLVLEGELHFEVDDRPSIRLGPGDVVALPPGVPHAVIAGVAPVRAVDAWSRDALRSRFVRDPLQPVRPSGDHANSPDRSFGKVSILPTDLESDPPIRRAKCCKTCISFDNPSTGHGRCMRRPTTHSIDYNAPRVLVDASNICDWHEEAPRTGSHSTQIPPDRRGGGKTKRRV